MRNYKLNEPVFYIKAKKKAIIKEFLPSGLIRITFYNKEDKREIADVLEESITKYKEKDKIYFAKVKSNAIIPSKRHEDGCYDIYSCFDEDALVINRGQTVLVPTGIASSFSSKYRINCARERGSTGKIGLQVLAGQIDSGYRDMWFVALRNSTNKTIIISKSCGTKITEEENRIFYPYSKAICQAAVEYVPDVRIQEIPYEQLEKIPSQRGKTKLGQSGK